MTAMPTTDVTLEGQYMPLPALATELDRIQQTKRDLIADTRQLTVLGAAEMHVPDLGEFGITSHAHGQLATRLDVPRKFYDRLRGDDGLRPLFDQTMNTLLRHEPKRWMVRTLDGRARAFLSDRYRRLDNFDLAQHVFPVLSEIPGAEFMRCYVDESKLYVHVTTPRVQAEVAAGDVVQAGVIITNSEVGLGALNVQPWLLRLVCTNGMTAPDSALRRYHVGKRAAGSEDPYELFSDETMRLDDAAFFAKVADVTRAAVSEATFGAIVDKMRRSMDVGIEGDPVQAVEVLSNKTGLDDGERSGVLRHLIEGGDLSMYGFLNAMTRTAQDATDPHRAADLEAAGGGLLDMTAESWREVAVAGAR